MVTIYYTYSSEYILKGAFEKLLNQIPAIFHQRARRYQNREDAYNFVLGRLLLKQAIKDKGLNLDSADMYYNEEGKPLLEGLSFSISHSQNLVACAFSTSVDLGLDVEYPRVVKKEYFRHYFSAEEWNEIITDKTLHTFYQYWTKKEAILKAAGVGLPHLLDITIQNEQEATICINSQRQNYYTRHLTVVGASEAYICLCSNEILSDIEIKKREITNQ